MAHYVTLFQFTEQGARNIKETVARTRKAIAELEKGGGKMTVYWTQGRYDMVAIGEGSEELAMVITLGTAKLGNVRTETLRAFTAEEMESFLKKVP